MKHRLVLLALISAALLVAAPASAKDLNGRFAVGGGTTLLGNSGLLVKYYVGHLGIGMMASYLTVTEEQGLDGDPGKKGDHVQNEADVSLRLSFNIARAKETNFIGGGGFTYGNFSDKSITGEEESWSEMGVELFLGLEHFFSNHFSLTFETGLPMRFYSDDHGPAIGRLTGAGIAALGAGKTIRIGGISPTLATTFNFYF